MKLTKEVREQLIGLLPMDNSEYDFTPNVFDKIPEEFQPTFKITQLDNGEANKVKEMMYLESMSDGKTRKKSIAKEIQNKNDVYMDMVFNHLRGWDNLYNAVTGEPFDYDGEKETMLKLPEVVLTAIFSKMMEVSGFLPKEIFED